VNVPVNLVKHERREVADKRDMQRALEPDPHPLSSSHIAQREQTPVTQRKVSISFTSTPAGASIRLDGESDPAWVTPYTIADIAPGTHQVVFYKQGYSPEFRELEVGARDESYGVDLLPK
jgi:hypothetical protein